MDSGRFAQADTILAGALALDPAEREGFLRTACGGDTELHALVLRLLRHAAEEAPGLEAGAAVRGSFGGALIDAAAPEDELQPGTRVDRYKVCRRLGEGGMATVYLAERIDGQLEQRVALKVLKRGVDSDEVLRRFRQEGRIMALASSASIARVLDGGAMDDGRPFLAMEYVDGQPIDSYCEELGLGTRARIRLFLQVALAVGYAHRNLVIHRDIKPSNILVSREGDVKLLDFGIAKLLDGEPGRDEETRTDHRMLTPAYASPEQLEGGPVTTASDIYQLGLLLYRLLTGCSPFPIEPTSDGSLRALTTQPPIRPSQAARSSSGLRRQLRGDLDNILLKVLRREPERRYGSVDQLVEDLERHLAGLAVAARPDTLLYRMQTLGRRYPFAVGAGALFVVTLLGSSILLARQAQRLTVERDRAARVADQVIELFPLSDPNRRLDKNAETVELLERSSDRLRVDLADDPAMHGRLEYELGRVYTSLGLFDRALTSQQSAVDLFRQTLGDLAEPTTTARSELARTQIRLGRYDAAEQGLNGVIEAQTRSLGANHPETLKSRMGLANVYWARGEYPASEPLYRELMFAWCVAEGWAHRETLAARNNLALLRYRQGRLTEAERMLDGVLRARREVLGESHPLTLGTANALALVQQSTGRHEESRRILERVVEAQRRELGDRHVETLNTLTNLAGSYYFTGDLDRAADLAGEVLRIREEDFGVDHPVTVAARLNVGLILLERHDYSEAERQLLQALAGAKLSLAESSSDMLSVRTALGELYRDTERRELSESQFRLAVQGFREAAPNHPELRPALLNLASVTADSAEAIALLTEALDLGLSREELANQALDHLRDRSDFPGN